MPISLRVPALAASLALALPAALSAQECEVDLTQPTQLFTAGLAIQRIAGEPESEGAPRVLRDAARQLQDARRFEANPVGYAFTRAQIMILWLHRPDAKEQMTLGELNLGRGKDRDTPVDLIGTADSLLSFVEEEMPACASETIRWRQSKPWNDRIAAAYRLLGTDDLDSAEHYANQAARFDRSSPFLFNALAQIALKRDQPERAVAMLDTAITNAAADTSFDDTRRQMRIQRASVLQEWGGGLEDTQRRNALLARASRQFLDLAHETPSAPDAPIYVSVGLDLAMMIQDSALLADGLRPMLENPEPYSDLALLIGGEVGRMTSNNAVAMRLYGATIKKNPNARDANYFLAYLLIDGNQGEEALPMLDRLIEIDPSNGDNFVLKSIVIRNRATALGTIRDTERDATRRQAMLREIRALNAQADSLALRESNMPHKVQIIGFERRAQGAKLTAAIDNRSQAARTYTIEMSFLDLSGEVLETITATTESVAPGATGSVEMTATKPGIVAWRYKALQ